MLTLTNYDDGTAICVDLSQFYIIYIRQTTKSGTIIAFEDQYQEIAVLSVSESEEEVFLGIFKNNKQKMLDNLQRTIHEFKPSYQKCQLN